MTTLRRLARWAVAHSQALGLSFLLALVAAAAVWFFAFFVPGRRQAAIGECRRDLSAIADARRDFLDRRIVEETEHASFVATFPTVRALVSSSRHGGSGEEPDAHVEGILSNFRNVFGERSISIRDTAGAVLVSSGGPGPGADAVALAREAAHTGKARVDLVREADGFIGFVVAVPVAGGSELAEAGAAGAVLVVGDAGRVFDVLSRPMRTWRSGESLLVRRDQESILYLSPLLFRQDPPLTLRLPLATTGIAARAALSGKDEFRAFVDYRGARVLAAVRRLANVPWGLVVKVDEDEALAVFRKDVLQSGITWGALLVALLAAAFGLWRALVAAQEVALARGEARFGALVEQATDTIFLVGSDGRVLQANRAAEVMYGRTRDELLSMHATDVRASGTRDTLRHDMEIAAARGSLLVETRHRRADGSEFPVEVNLGLVKAGDETLFLAIVRDMTERKAAEERIRKLNRLLRTISEVNQLLVRATDEEPLLKEVCRILVSHGGYALAWIGRADRETMRFVPVASAGDESGYLERIEVRWDDTPEGRGPLGTAIREGRPIVSDVQVDPTVAPWRDSMLRQGFGSIAALPVRRGGAVTAGLAVYAKEKAFIDEEEIALLEELAGDLSFALDALDDRERAHKSDLELRKLARAVEQTPATVLITDLEGRIEYVNPWFTEVTGYTAEEARGQNPRILKSDRTPPEAYRAMWETITAGRVWQGELCNKKKDGALFWEQASISAIRDEHGTTMNYVAVKEDITAKKRAAEELEKTQQQLQQAQKMEAVGRLAGGVAHDFNNLLTVIQGYGELLAASLEGDPERRESVVEIVKATERAATLTRQLLAFSRQQVLEMRVLDVGAVVADTEKMLKRLIGEDIEVVVVKAAAPGRVKADPGQISQVVLNLAVNARDAMPGGGRLTLDLANADLEAPLAAAHEAIPPGRYVVLSVTDTGSGMDAETLGHIFEPFFTTKERGKGTGLGLATVYGIVRQTGGYVAVETVSGAGTTFRVYLPRYDEPTTSGVRPAVASPHGTETVLLVEDEPAVRAFAKVVLERQGYTVLAAESGAAALDLVDKHTGVIHVLLTDVVMPGMNGRDLASRVAALRPSIKVVLMSGYSADVLPGFDVKAGQMFISKPFNERALAAKIREALDAPPA